MILYVLVVIISFILLLRIPKVVRSAKLDLKGLRQDPNFKRMDILSRLDLACVICILIVSVLMYP